MLENFLKIAEKLFKPTDKILLGVSGGVDSMVMLNLFSKSKFSFAVAHCNFGLRGGESDGDTELVKMVCKDMGVKLHTIFFDTHAQMEISGESTQMVARRLRYHWFNSLCEQNGYSAVAIAHNSGDSIETFFINLIRGTGVRGLSGIAAVRGNIVRPIIGFSREEIEHYATTNGVVWRNDSTNNGTKYLRNKIRHLILPLVEEIEPDFADVMGDNIEKVSQAVRFIDNLVSKIRDKATTTYRGKTTISMDIISHYEPLDFTLYELLSPFGFNHTVCSDIVRSYRSDNEGHSFRSKTHIAVLSRKLLIVSEIVAQKQEIDDVINKIVPHFEGCDYTLDFEILDTESVESFIAPPSSAFFDIDKLQFPLTVRHWCEGDIFVPFGMKGHKKLSDFFVDNKINIVDKATEKLLINANGDIVWLMGRRSDNRYRVDATSKRILKIRYKKIV